MSLYAICGDPSIRYGVTNSWYCPQAGLHPATYALMHCRADGFAAYASGIKSTFKPGHDSLAEKKGMKVFGLDQNNDRKAVIRANKAFFAEDGAFQAEKMRSNPGNNFVGSTAEIFSSMRFKDTKYTYSSVVGGKTVDNTILSENPLDGLDFLKIALSLNDKDSNKLELNFKNNFENAIEDLVNSHRVVAVTTDNLEAKSVDETWECLKRDGINHHDLNTAVIKANSVASSIEDRVLSRNSARSFSQDNELRNGLMGEPQRSQARVRSVQRYTSADDARGDIRYKSKTAVSKDLSEALSKPGKGFISDFDD